MSELKNQFIYETNERKLNMLRINEKLDILIEGAKSEAEKIILLRNWAHNQIPVACFAYHPNYIHEKNKHGIGKSMPNNIFEQLKLYREHKIRWVLCGAYSTTFIQACLSVNIPARLIRLTNKDCLGHLTTDAYDREQKKWLWMDPNYDFCFIRNNKILSVLEIHNAYKKGEKIELKHIWIEPSESFTQWFLGYFNSFYLLLRNNFISGETEDKYAEWVDGISKEKEFFWDE